MENEKQKMYLKSSIRQAFNHPYVHMLNHIDKMNDNHIKMQKKIVSLFLTKALHCSGLL